MQFLSSDSNDEPDSKAAAAATLQRVKSLISDEEIMRTHPVIIFSKSYCPFCKNVKALFSELLSGPASTSLTPFVVELDVSRDGPAVQAALLELTGQKTVPNVFVRGEYVGGNDACQQEARNGRMQERLGLSDVTQAEGAKGNVDKKVIRTKSGRDVTATLDKPGQVKERVKELLLDPDQCAGTHSAATGTGEGGEGGEGVDVDQQQLRNPARVVIFSKSYCPFCAATKRLFAAAYEKEYQTRGGKRKTLYERPCVIELDQSEDGLAIQHELLVLTGQRTVPSVWIGGSHVGGNDDAQALAASGELERRLEAAATGGV